MDLMEAQKQNSFLKNEILILEIVGRGGHDHDEGKEGVAGQVG